MVQTRKRPKSREGNAVGEVKDSGEALMDPINIASMDIYPMDNSPNVHIICIQEVSLSKEQLQAKVAGSG